MDRKDIIGCILAYALSYGLVAFVNWEWNPGFWGENARFSVALMGTAGAVCWFVIMGDA